MSDSASLSATFKWIIKGWSEKGPDLLRSQTFSVGGHNW